MHRRNLEQSKQRQQFTSASTGDKEDGREDGDDATSSEDGSTLESTSSTTLSHTSNSINEAITVSTQSGRTLRTRRIASKSVPRRLHSARREFTSFCGQSDGNCVLKNGDDEDDGNNYDDGNGSDGSRVRRFVRVPKPSVSRMIADKILTKSIARTRRKRYAAAVATDALKRIKEPNSTGSKRRLGKDDDGSYHEDDDNSDLDDDYHGGSGDDDNDRGGNGDDDEVEDTDKEKGRTHARKKHCSSDDNDDDKSYASDKMISGNSTSRKSERKRQRLQDKEVEPMMKKRSKDIDDAKRVRFFCFFQ